MRKTLESFTIAETDTCEAHRIFFYDYGPVDSARTAICVHGLGRNARDFDALATCLAAQGTRVLALDMPGRGNSDKLQNAMHYHYGTYMADCIKLMDNFHLRGVDFIGTSMGGIIGMMIAAEDHRRIKRLVLNDIGSFIPKQALLRIYGYMQQAPAQFSNYEEAEIFFKTNYQSFGIETDEEWRRFIEDSIEKNDETGGYRFRCDPRIVEPLRAMSENFTNVHDVNLSEIWEKISIPTLIIRGGESDVLMDYTLSAMKSTNLKAESIEFEGIGHAPLLQNEVQIAPILRFLHIGGNHAIHVGL